ncbi:MAG: ATP-binding region ATPase domain protein [Frankiales bacterium]|nr:ATP-binding region ATPase domain protein [Frankiales bacterium]
MDEQAGTATDVVVTRPLVALPRAAADARRVLREALDGTALEDRCHDAQLAISELVTNAVLHAHEPICLRVLVDDSRARFEVVDGSALAPSFTMLDPTAVTGRGLLLVVSLADRWGVEPRADGKAVWFELDAGPGPAPSLDLDDLLASWGEDLEDPAQEVVKVVLTELDTGLTARSEAHVEALLRELALVAHAREASEELRLVAERVLHAASGVEELRAEVKQQLSRAVMEGLDVVDVVLRVTRVDAETVRTFARAVDEADRLSRQGLLLTGAVPYALSEARARYLRRLVNQLST